MIIAYIAETISVCLCVLSFSIFFNEHILDIFLFLLILFFSKDIFQMFRKKLITLALLTIQTDLLTLSNT